MVLRLPYSQLNKDRTVLTERKFTFYKKIGDVAVICGLYIKRTIFNPDGTVNTIQNSTN